MSLTHGGGKPYVGNGSYSPPQGPKDQMREGPGLGGSNAGNTRQPTSTDGSSGSPGIGGTNHGNCGSQGRG